MTYREIFDLKYNKGLSTYELVRRFPHEIERVSEVALLDIPESTLKDVLPEQKVLKRVKDLRKKFLIPKKKS